MKNIFIIGVLIFSVCTGAYPQEKAMVVKNVDFYPATGKIGYELKLPALVRVRIGMVDGPLYAAVLNWQLKQPGVYTEQWSGKDNFGVIALSGRKDIVCTFNYIAQGVDIVENSDIIAGVPAADNIIGHKLSTASINRIHKNHKRENCRDVVLNIKFLSALPKTKDGFYIVKKDTPLEVSFDPKDVAMFRNERYAVHIFVDDIFVSGEIDGYAPYVWIFDPSRLNQGKHVIIINYAGYDDHYGVGVLPVYVKR